MTILTPSLQSWVYPALHRKKGKGLRFPNTEKAPKHRQSQVILPEGASAALADLKYCVQGQFMVTEWTTWSQPCNLPLPQLWGLPVYLWRLKPPCNHPSYQTAVTLTSFLTHSMVTAVLRCWDHCRCIPGSRVFRPSGSGLCLPPAAGFTGSPWAMAMWTLQGNRPPRGILGLWQPSWTALEWGGG